MRNRVGGGGEYRDEPGRWRRGLGGVGGRERYRGGHGR